MAIDEKVQKTLPELGVIDAAGVEALFADVRIALAEERIALVTEGATSESERDKLCKELRDRWLARKNGLLSLLDENWLKKSPKELKPYVGRNFNSLRQESAAMEVAALTRDVPILGAAAGSREDFAAQSTSTTISNVTREVPNDLTLPGN